jgi:hypothetical protein
MTQKDIIRMAREAGPDWWLNTTMLERFAALVAAYEREACAKGCEELGEANRDAFAQYDCAAAIRARGEK